MNKGAWTLRQVRTFRGMEGPGFNANLYRGDTKVAVVDDHGSGGPVDARFLDRNGSRNTPSAEEDILTAHVKTLPQEECYGTMLDVSVDWFLGELFGDWQDEKRYRRLCKTKIVFTLKSKPGVFLSLNTPYRVPTKATLELKYGDDLGEIVNERYL